MKSIIIAALLAATCAWGESFYGYNTKTKEVGIINDHREFIPNPGNQVQVLDATNVPYLSGTKVAPWGQVPGTVSNGQVFIEGKWHPCVSNSPEAPAIVTVQIITNGPVESDNGRAGCPYHTSGSCLVFGCDKLSVPATERYRVTEVIEITTFKIEYNGRTYSFTTPRTLEKKRVTFRKRDVWDDGTEQDITGTQQVTLPDGTHMDLVDRWVPLTNSFICITNVDRLNSNSIVIDHAVEMRK